MIVSNDRTKVAGKEGEAPGELAFADINRLTGYIEAFTNERHKASGTRKAVSGAKF